MYHISTKQFVFFLFLLLIIPFVIGFLNGKISGEKSFIENNYGIEYVVVEKTIKSNKTFEYVVESENKHLYVCKTNEDLGLGDVITFLRK